MKPFITEQQLALMKYQPNSKYFNETMASIAMNEFLSFLHGLFENKVTPLDTREYFNHFLHRQIDDKTWIYYFQDDSRLAMSMSFDNDETIYSMRPFDSHAATLDLCKSEASSLFR